MKSNTRTKFDFDTTSSIHTVLAICDPRRLVKHLEDRSHVTRSDSQRRSAIEWEKEDTPIPYPSNPSPSAPNALRNTFGDIQTTEQKRTRTKESLDKRKGRGFCRAGGKNGGTTRKASDISYTT